MTSRATVEGGDRLRLFLALQLPDDVVDTIEAWQHAVLRGGRIVARDHLHLTLAFLGSRPAAELDAIVAALRAGVARVERPRFEVRRYRETRSVAMLVLDDEGGRATTLADDVQERLEALAVYRREARPWLPHLTVLRFRERPRLAPPLPSLGPFCPSGAAAYLSRLHPSGARYEVLDSVPL
ncbi:MAG: 2'-5' RNA ligase family protein [Pseudomonadota bacterium]